MTTVVIADDHPIVLGGLARLINEDPDFRVIGSASDGEAIARIIEESRPEIAVLDINMPRRSGLEVLAALHSEGSPVKVVLLAATMTDAEIFSAVTAGAAAVALKETAPSILMDCLHAVAGGARWLPSELVVDAIAREELRRHKWQTLSMSLTPRELEIVGLVVGGASNKDISFKLKVSEGTAKVHLNNIFRKLQLGSRHDLQLLADGLVETERPAGSDPGVP